MLHDTQIAHTGRADQVKSGQSAPAQFGGISGGQLKSIIERIERLEEEKAALAVDIKDVFAEAKANGFDTKVLRAILKIRKQDGHERSEFEALLDVYMAALGMVPED